MKGEQPVTVSHMSRLVQTEKDWRAMTNVAKPREALEYRRDRRKYNARSALCIRCDCCGLRCEHYLTANHSRLILRVTVVVSSRYRLLQLRFAVWQQWDRRHRSKRNSCIRVLIIRSPVIRNYVLFSTTNSRGYSSAKVIMQPTLCGKGLGLEKWLGDGSSTIKHPSEFSDSSLSLSY